MLALARVFCILSLATCCVACGGSGEGVSPAALRARDPPRGRSRTGGLTPNVGEPYKQAPASSDLSKRRRPRAGVWVRHQHKPARGSSKRKQRLPYLGGRAPGGSRGHRQAVSTGAMQTTYGVQLRWRAVVEPRRAHPPKSTTVSRACRGPRLPPGARPVIEKTPVQSRTAPQLGGPPSSPAR